MAFDFFDAELITLFDDFLALDCIEMHIHEPASNSIDVFFVDVNSKYRIDGLEQ